MVVNCFIPTRLIKFWHLVQEEEFAQRDTPLI
jgi:hypothetical protein